MKIKTSELTGAALDWAVAKCEFEGCEDWDGTLDGVDSVSDMQGGVFNPTENWSQAGPILQNHISELIDCGEGGWEACCNGTYGATGSTALEAVCLAYVASKLGDEVEVPDELA